MHFTVSAVFLLFCLANLAVNGKTYKEYHVPAKYATSMKEDGEVHPVRMPAEIEKVPFIEHTVDNVEGHVGLSEFIETSSVPMEVMLKKMKLQAFQKKCHKKGKSCYKMTDCCSTICYRSLGKCA